MKPLDWHSLWVPELSPLEVVLRAALTYLFVQLVLRLGGRKQLGRRTTFDIAMLFLLATALRQTIVGEDSSLTSGFLGLATIAALDRLLGWLAMRSERNADLLQGPVRQIARDGRISDDELRRAKVSRDDVLAEVRAKGGRSLDELEEAFLERSGHISVRLRE